MSKTRNIQRILTDTIPGAPADDLPRIPPQERRRMIEEAAYYLAEHRHFTGGAGDPTSDWLLAEAAVDRKLDSGP